MGRGGGVIKTGYFQKGELKVGEERNERNDSNVENVSGRVFLNANRRLPQHSTHSKDREDIEYSTADKTSVVSENNLVG